MRQLFQSVKKRILPKGRAYRRILFGPARGCWMNLDLANELRMYLGVFERELWTGYRELLKPGMKCFDIGGRDGYSALVMAASTRGQVVSFECDPTAIPQMRDVFLRNAMPILAEEAFIGSDGGKNTTLTLDAAADRFFRPDFLKIDVEGAEADVLRGAKAIMRNSPPAMIVEVHGLPAEQDCLALLAQFNYSVKIVDRTEIFPEQRPLSHNRWLICKPERTTAAE